MCSYNRPSYTLNKGYFRRFNFGWGVCTNLFRKCLNGH